MDFAAIAKAHFDLGGVHVDVHTRRVHLDIEGVDGLLVAMQHIFISGTGRVGQHLVAHKAAVDIAKLMVRARARSIGHTSAAGDMQGACPVIDGDGIFDEVIAQHIAQAAGDGFVWCAAGGAPLLDQLAFVPDGKAHIRARQRMAAHGFNAVGQLGRIRLEEFAARRGGEEQFLDFYRRALIAGRRAQLATAGIEQKGGLLPSRAREDGGLRHRGNSGQRFATETHGGHGFQVMQVGNLAGGVAAQGHGQLVTRYAAAIVFHRNQAHATGQQAHGDLAGAGVQRVVHQLAHGRGGAFHHLASGDLADQLIGQVTNGPARRCSLVGGGRRGGGEFRAGCVHVDHSRRERKSPAS